MSAATMTWQEFRVEAEEFLKISEKLGDDWTLVKKDDGDARTFLVFKQKKLLPGRETSDLPDDLGEVSQDEIESAGEMLQIEYHVVYSVSYQVPILYFRAHRSDGGVLGLEDAWQLFRAGDPGDGNKKSREDMLSILTQMEHPVEFKPFLALHPCRTADLLGQAGSSRNRVITFLSLMGPYVGLDLNLEYSLHFKEETTAAK